MSWCQAAGSPGAPPLSLTGVSPSSLMLEGSRARCEPLSPEKDGAAAQPQPRTPPAARSLPRRPAPYLVVPLVAPGRALVLLRVRGSSSRGPAAAAGSRVAGAGALRPARGLPARRRAPEPPAAAEAGASGRQPAAVRPGPGAVGRRVMRAAVAPGRGGHGAAAAGGRAAEPAARIRRRRGSEALPVHGPAAADRERNKTCVTPYGHERGLGGACRSLPVPRPAARRQRSGLTRFRAGKAKRGAHVKIGKSLLNVVWSCR